ncbi:hypothetical protein 1 [Yongsan tombus-like virus 1]|uniref:hypothetical protein 1 n=1 Tax=Yongsan tombus-like virus 1 TaxID=2315813 RepID=UPI000EB68619|nr:hypothetical protein 1 [Yongsan tombus-like virus 1]AXV43890.1 hypothetical protein 1 [Yongsan tombus-like virus 1]
MRALQVELQHLRRANSALQARVRDLEGLITRNTSAPLGGSGPITTIPRGSRRSTLVRASGVASTPNLNSSPEPRSQRPVPHVNTTPPVSRRQSSTSPRVGTPSRPQSVTALTRPVTPASAGQAAEHSTVSTQLSSGPALSPAPETTASKTVVSHPYAGAILEATRAKGELAHDERPVYVADHAIDRSLRESVGITRRAVNKMTAVDEEEPKGMWRYLPKVRSPALRADKYLLFFLLNKFAFIERSPDTMRRMWESLNQVMRDFDTRNNTIEEIYLLKHQAVRAAMVPPAEELRTRKLLQEAPNLDKHAKFTKDGHLGHKLEASLSTIGNLFQPTKSLPTKK